MATKDFVEATGRQKYWQLVEKELELLHDENGMLKTELHKAVKCSVCGTDNTKALFYKEGFTFVKCSECGLIYVNPQCDTSRLNQYYEGESSADYWVEVLLSAAEQDYDINKFTNCCKDIEALTDGRRVLDVGCSIGLYLKIAKERGWDTVGLELNTKAYEYAKNELGLDVRQKLLDEAGFEKDSFDVVTLWEVLEHVPDPRSVLEQVSDVLKPGGVLAILVPNRNGLSVRIMRERCACFGGRNHLWYFAPDNLKSLLEQTGYEVVKTGTQLSQADEIMTYLNFKDPYHEKREEDDFEIDADLVKKLEKFIFENHLGYKLLMYARKK